MEENNLKKILSRLNIKLEDLAKKIPNQAVKVMLSDLGYSMEELPIPKNYKQQIIIALNKICKEIGVEEKYTIDDVFLEKNKRDIFNKKYKELIKKSGLFSREEIVNIYTNSHKLSQEKIEKLESLIVEDIDEVIILNKTFNDNKYLKLELDIPDDLSDKELKSHIEKLVVQFDNLHRSKGGSGLKLRDLSITKIQSLIEA